MTQRIGQGGAIPLDAVFQDGTGQLVDPVTPLVDIVDPSSVTVVNNAVPVRDSLGTFHYDYPVDAAAPLGLWTASWSGVINGVPVSADDPFEVVAAGTVDFPDAGDLLATVADVEGIWRTLSAAEAVVAANLIRLASAMVRQRVGTVDARIAAGTLDAVLVAGVVATMVRRVLLNPEAVRSHTAGQVSVTVDNLVSSGALFMSADEVALLAGSVYVNPVRSLRLVAGLAYP